MVKNNSELEKLDDEQLEQVSGGTAAQTRVDRIFFRHFGYNTEKVSVENAFLDNGIKFSDNYGNNSYKILTSDGEWTNHPHWAVLGRILQRKNYPGFNGNWTDLNYVKPFLKNNFDITVD